VSAITWWWMIIYECGLLVKRCLKGENQGIRRLA
jgi:hypothetical protein